MSIASVPPGKRGEALPRVTFVLLAFNQQQFVDESVAATFAQDYPNLQIVLSDDNSSDATFARLQSLAAAYDGPHSVVLNRTMGGKGILAHVYDAVAKSDGDLIVLGAADDISYPNRVSRLVEAWRETGADALFSGFDRIDERGRPLGPSTAPPRTEYDPAPYFAHGNAFHLTGCSTAYTRRMFEAVSLPEEYVAAEDYFLGLMLAWRSRRVEHVPESLLAYRAHNQSLTHLAAPDVRSLEQRAAWTAATFAGIMRLFDRIVSSGSGVAPDWGKPAEVRFGRLRADAAYLELRAKWMDLPFRRRLAGMARFRRPHQLRWMAPRLFGIKGLTAIKHLAGRPVQPSSNSE